MAIFGHIKNLFTLSPVMKRPIRPFFSLPTQKHFMVKIECQIEKWKYLFESHILPYQPNKTLHAHPILLSCYSHNVFTSACYVWTIIWGDCASWMKHFAKCSLNTPLQKKCLSHNLDAIWFTRVPLHFKFTWKFSNLDKKHVIQANFSKKCACIRCFSI